MTQPWDETLGALERWAEQEAQRSDADSEWRARRAYVQAHQDEQAEVHRLALWEVEGAESAYADAAARLAHVRGRLAVVAEDQRRAMALAALRGELSWAMAQRAEAFAQSGSAVDPEELHAKGRAEALGVIGAELGALAEAERSR